MKKGQVAIEFLAYVSLFLLFSSGILVLIYNMQEIERNQESSKILYSVGRQYVEYINLAKNAGDGFVGTFFVPNKILNQAYNVSIYNDTITNQAVLRINNSFSTYNFGLGLTNYDYSFNGFGVASQIDNINIADGKIIIKNQGGVIKVE